MAVYDRDRLQADSPTYIRSDSWSEPPRWPSYRVASQHGLGLLPLFPEKHLNVTFRDECS